MTDSKQNLTDITVFVLTPAEIRLIKRNRFYENIEKEIDIKIRQLKAALEAFEAKARKEYEKTTQKQRHKFETTVLPAREEYRETYDKLIIERDNSIRAFRNAEKLSIEQEKKTKKKKV